MKYVSRSETKLGFCQFSTGFDISKLEDGWVAEKCEEKIVCGWAETMFRRGL